MPPTTPLLKLEQVSKQFSSAEGAPPLVVLRNITLEIARGESVAIVGPSGCGKSTLLNLLGTLDRPDAGQIWLDGQDLAQFGDRKLAAVRNRQIGFVFQAHHLLPHCTVWENVLVPTLALGDEKLRATAPEHATRLLKRVGLGERLHHRPGQLSGGERQRAAVARALINSPKLLLADEPTGALDRASAERLADLLAEVHQREKITIVMVTHSPELACRMGRMLGLVDGKLADEKRPTA